MGEAAVGADRVVRAGEAATAASGVSDGAFAISARGVEMALAACVEGLADATSKAGWFIVADGELVVCRATWPEVGRGCGFAAVVGALVCEATLSTAVLTLGVLRGELFRAIAFDGDSAATLGVGVDGLARATLGEGVGDGAFWLCTADGAPTLGATCGAGVAWRRVATDVGFNSAARDSLVTAVGAAAATCVLGAGVRLGELRVSDGVAVAVAVGCGAGVLLSARRATDEVG